jgi:hypothetical protein
MPVVTVEIALSLDTNIYMQISMQFLLFTKYYKSEIRDWPFSQQSLHFQSKNGGKSDQGEE